MGTGSCRGTFEISMSSDVIGAGRRCGMGKFMSGSIDKVASKGSEEMRVTDVTSVREGADGSGHCQRADGVALRRAGDGRRWGDTAGSWRN